MKEQWRQQLQDKMADYSQPAPPMSWDEIEKAVAAQRQPRRARHLSLWQRMSAAAAITLLMGVAVSLLWHSSSDSEQQLAASSAPSATPSATTSGISTPTTTATTEPNAKPLADKPLLAQHAQHQAPQPTSASVAESRPQTASPVASPSPQATATSEAPQSATRNSEEVALASSSEIAETTASPSATRKQTALPSAIDWNEDRAATTHEHRLMAQASVSNGFLNTTSLQRSGMMNAYASNSIQDTFSATTDELDRPVLTTGTVPTERVHHRLPVRFALSLSYELSPRWSLSAGVAYTLLSADVTRDMGAHEEQWKQSLHYVGIPLHVNYQLWSTRRLQLYATMGATVEKMVSGSRTLQTGDAGQTDVSESVSIHPLQLSIDGGLGAAYAFHPQFSLYAEPTVGYHFDNGSSVPTYYQKHQYSWGLTVGLRMQLNSK